MRPDPRREEGWVLVTAISLLAVMLTVAFASVALVDTQQKQNRFQRERESSLNLSEGVLSAQGFVLAQKWPGTPAQAVIDCTSGVSDTRCPDAGTLAGPAASANFANVDQKTGATWRTFVRDNGGPLSPAYAESSRDATQNGTNAQTGAAYSCPGPCRWDANGDKVMWVQARGVVRGRPRNIVAQLKLESLREATPQTAVVAGGIKVNNSGNKHMLYAVGSQVVVRCNPSSSRCVGAQQSGNPPQISPQPVQGNPPPMLTPQQLERFRTRAKTDGTYFPAGTCPADHQLLGAVVFVEACNSANMNGPGSACPGMTLPPPPPGGGGTGLKPGCVNNLAKPGYLIWHCGQMNFASDWTFVGVIYGVNNSDGTCPAGYPARGTNPPDCSGNNNSPNNVVTITGGFGVLGAIAIDGNGCLFAGNNGLQLQFDPNVFGAVASYGTVGLVQNTWRELKSGIGA